MFHYLKNFLIVINHASPLKILHFIQFNINAKWNNAVDWQFDYNDHFIFKIPHLI